MRFGEIIGQDDLKSQLRKYIQSERLPHALMFSGPLGRGSLALALATSAYLFCENRSDTDSCGKCQHCTKIDKLMHPDLHFSFPVVKLTNSSKARKDTFSDDFLKSFRAFVGLNPYVSYQDWMKYIDAENKQGDINVKECFEILRKLGLKSFSGKYKILVFWLPEFLGNNGNRLLKLIEEPPDDCFLIFVTEDRQLLLNTLLSRVQLLQVPPIDHKSLLDFLIKNQNIEKEIAEQVSFQAEGNLSTAMSIQDNVKSNITEQVLQWLRMCYQSNPESLSGWIDQFDKIGKEQQKYMLEYTIHVIRQFVRMEYMSNEDLSIKPEEISTLNKLANFLNFDQCEKISALLSEAIYGLERNLHTKIMMMALSIELSSILRKKQAVIA